MKCYNCRRTDTTEFGFDDDGNPTYICLCGEMTDYQGQELFGEFNLLVPVSKEEFLRLNPGDIPLEEQVRLARRFLGGQ